MTDIDRQLVDRHAYELAEHFDSVRIFVTRHHGGKEDTASYSTGRGNFYASLGLVHEWVAMQDQIQREATNNVE